MRRFVILFLILLTSTLSRGASAHGVQERVRNEQSPGYIFRLYLTDKHGTPYSVDRPSRFLSRRSVNRRIRQHLEIDSTDLPITPRYLRQLRQLGARIVGRSRWQNTVLVKVADSAQIRQYVSLPFVKASKMVWQAPDSITLNASRLKVHERFEDYHYVPDQPYGQSHQQIHSLQGWKLHDIGMRGEGMMIAVIDGGFKNVDQIPAFRSADICGYRDFVSPQQPALFVDTDHGTKVLSAMAVNIPNYYIGSAPKASYWLLRAEDQQSEQEVEEDYWTMAAEFADSVGCDLINSSLGYNEYDYPFMSHRLWQLDGRTAFVSRAASMLAAKGVILVNSAGNSGMGHWKKIGVPADADHILTVGAVNDDNPVSIAPFSSVGPSQDGRVKPDVVALGAPASLINGRGVIMQDMGTSFSTPTVCGLTACLWQAMPHLKAEEIIELIRCTSNNCEHPDNVYGYGVPDFWQAYLMGKVDN